MTRWKFGIFENKAALTATRAERENTMKKNDIIKATRKTRFNRARETHGKFTHTFSNAIDGARPFRGVNKKHSTLGLNATITEEEFARECKEYGAEKVLKSWGVKGVEAAKLLRTIGFTETHAARLLKALGLDEAEEQRKAPRLAD